MVINLHLIHMDKSIFLLLTDRWMVTIFLVVMISVPFIVFQNRISKWLSSTVEEADNKKEEKENSMSQSMYTLLMVLHVPLFLNTVFASPYLFVYILVYLIAGSSLLMVDPWGLITSNNFPPIAFIGATVLSYATLLSQPYSVIKLVCILALCISFTNIIRTYTDETTLFGYFLLYTILHCLAYGVVLYPSILQTIRNAINAPGTAGPIVQMNTTLLLCVFFFVLLFYLPTLFKNYYGGTVLVREPIPLNVPKEIEITPSYPYTLSYCVYLDSVPPEYNFSTTLHSNLVSCGYGVQTKYESSTQSFRILTKKPKMNIFETELLPQRWNHIVLVSDNTQLDMYINGELVSTVHSLSPTEKYMMIGQKGGVKGKICSVLYSTTPISNVMVKQLYYQLKTQDPPLL